MLRLIDCNRSHKTTGREHIENLWPERININGLLLYNLPNKQQQKLLCEQDIPGKWIVNVAFILFHRQFCAVMCKQKRNVAHMRTRWWTNEYEASRSSDRAKKTHELRSIKFLEWNCVNKAKLIFNSALNAPSVAYVGDRSRCKS